jgi:hypothetical protein
MLTLGLLYYAPASGLRNKQRRPKLFTVALWLGLEGLSYRLSVGVSLGPKGFAGVDRELTIDHVRALKARTRLALGIAGRCYGAVLLARIASLPETPAAFWVRTK